MGGVGCGSEKRGSKEGVGYLIWKWVCMDELVKMEKAGRGYGKEGFNSNGEGVAGTE